MTKEAISTERALKLALVALECSQEFTQASADGKVRHGWGNQLDDAEKAITALREALADIGFPISEQPAQQEPVADDDVEYYGMEPWESDKMKSATAGMNMAERILHVGGRNNAAGYVEFGSIQAVEALVRQVLRDLPAQQQKPVAWWRLAEDDGHQKHPVVSVEKPHPQWTTTRPLVFGDTPPPAPPQQEPVAGMDEMVNRFLAWPLPKSVCTDPCTSWPGYSHSRCGTSLLTAIEARQMLEHVLQNTSPPAQRKPLTDEEIGKAWSVADGEHNASASVKRRITRAIEAKLKENT